MRLEGVTSPKLLGRVVTPDSIVNLMVEKLFSLRTPTPSDRVLDPGCGDGAFIKGILEWCRRKTVQPPELIGLEIDPKLLAEARRSLAHEEKVKLLDRDFLLEEPFSVANFIVGNPPYVRLERLSEVERRVYKARFGTAYNRFDLYMLFFEVALKCLALEGRLVFITPEKFEYTVSAKPLRRFIATNYHVEEIHHIDENAFRGLVTYPTITTINHGEAGHTRILLRDGMSFSVDLPSNGSPWTPYIHGEATAIEPEMTLADVCERISCGVATGRDKVFIIPQSRIPQDLAYFAYPTSSGLQLTSEGINLQDVMLVPYDRKGNLLSENQLGPLNDYLDKHREVLASRYCVRHGKMWYAFHENPPMKHLLKPKILCKDIAKEPRFWLDEGGGIIPRHSVYYIIPHESEKLRELLDYLNSSEAKEWLEANCQRAANGFLRLQSDVLKRLPVPKHLARRDFACG